MEKPILFNTEMVQAILESRKTQTRRIIKPQPKEQLKCVIPHETKGMACWMEENADQLSKDFRFYRSLEVGDILWVRETWTKVVPFADDGTWNYDNEKLYYYANEEDRKVVNEIDYCDDDGFRLDRPFPWHPSIHMPRAAARIFLKVKNVRAERLQDITEDGAIKEGIKSYTKDGEIFKYAVSDNWWMDYCNKHKKFFAGTFWQEMPRNPWVAFMYLWDSTIKKLDLDRYGWVANPWVWVIEFERLEG